MQKIKKVLEPYLRVMGMRPLFAKLLVFLSFISLAVILAQAGSLFLLDYIPSSQTSIEKIQRKVVVWSRDLGYISASKNDAEIAKKLTALTQHYINEEDPRFKWMVKQDDPILVNAVVVVKKAEDDYSKALKNNRSLKTQIRYAQKVLLSYRELSSAMYRDIEIKQSVVALLQLVSLMFILSCIIAIAVGARYFFINRLDRLIHFMNEHFHDSGRDEKKDEFADLEKKVHELSALMDSQMTEVTWAKKTSEYVRILLRAQYFLSRFVDMVSRDVLSERTLLKMLYSLERAMNFNNTAVIYTDDAAVISEQKVISSHQVPPIINKDVFDELYATGLASYTGVNKDGEEVRYLATTFSGSSGGFSILLVEFEKERFLEDAEVQVLEITATLLTMVAKFQSHDEEGRRLAVLEERAAIARELHDSLAQSLSYMKIQLARLQSKGAGSDSSTMLVELREGLDSAYRELRELLTTFRVHMDLRGLGYAIQSAIDEFSQRSRLSISFDNRLVNCRLTVNEEFHILHVVREALSNIVRHSGADNVSILMELRKAGTVELIIDDDGVGFTPVTNSYDHHGQAIMKERAYSLGGKIDVHAKRHGGTRVKLVFTPKLIQ